MKRDLFGEPLPVPEVNSGKKSKQEKTPVQSRYARFGLDTYKRSRDSGRAGYLFCPWCQGRPGYGYSLCFVNWVICRACVERGLSPVAVLEAEECFSCRRTGAVFLSAGEGIQVGICQQCLVTAGDALEKQKDAQPVDKKGQFLIKLS